MGCLFLAMVENNLSGHIGRTSFLSEFLMAQLFPVVTQRLDSMLISKIDF